MIARDRGPVLNPDPARRTEGAERLAAELLHAARELPASEQRLEKLAGSLHHLDPAAVSGDDTRLAFWINVYNALTQHALHREGARGSLILRLGMFWRAAYRIGPSRWSLNLIEHGLLRGNKRVPMSFFRAAKPGDARLAAAPSRVERRVHFALHCGARSCPPIRSYSSGELEKQLELATRSYFDSEAKIDRERGTITLPRLMKYYRDDFGTREEALRFAGKYLKEDDGAWVTERISRIRIAYAAYDWTIL